MARGGLIPFSGSFNRRIAEPLDDYRVATKADLLLASTWTAGDNGVYTFLGMFAIVYADGTNNGGYILTAENYTVAGNWLKVGSSVDLSDYVTKTSLFRNGLIKTELLPAVEDEVVELLLISDSFEISQTKAWGDLMYNTTTKKIYSFNDDNQTPENNNGWENPVTPSTDRVYLAKSDNLAYKWDGTNLVLTTKPLPYADDSDTSAGLSLVKVVTPKGLLYAFKNWVINTVHDGFTTASKTIQGAINELKTALGTKMTESDFVGSGATKSVNRAEIATSADNATNAWKDSLGNIISDTYATRQWTTDNFTLKDSGVEVPVASSIELTSLNQSYEIVDLTADNLDVKSTYAGKISKGTLTSDKAVKITNLGTNTITVAGTEVAAGVTCFFLYDFDTDTVSVSTVLDPTIPDYSDITVNQITTTATYIKYSAYYKIFNANFGGTTSGSLIFVNNEANKTYTGVYQALEGAGSGPFKAKLICTGTKLNTVRHIGGKSYISEYDGSNLSSLTFGVLSEKMQESEFVGGTASKSVQYSVHADFADTAGTASDAISCQWAQNAVHDQNGNVIEDEYATKTELGGKVDKNGTDRLLTQTEAELIEGMSPIEFEVTDVINGIIIPESPTKLYRISTATDLTVTINTGLLDLTKYIKLFVKINLNDYVVLTFPKNWYFANLAIPTEVGEYLYEVSSSDGGDTWRASQRYKNIATVGIDQEGNEIVGAKTLFVDGEKADNSGDGLTWLTAKKDVQAAIDIAISGDAVFVKGKIDGLKYLPTTERTPGTARTKSFIMKAGVNVYGGFKGIESTLYEREMVSYPQIMNLPTGTFTMYVDIPKYRSILSGEIAGSSVINPSATVGNQFTTASIANNSYTVVFGVTGTVINGFEIIGGNANIAGNNTGGGLLNGLATNCAIYNNSATTGGGVNGGTLTNCAIYNNSASNTGGGVGATTATNCAIYNNNATNGGGLFSGVATTCAIYRNRATTSHGGGANSTTVANCAIYNNSATTGGGGGFHLGEATNCAIYNNSATTGGGVNGGTLTNCAIYNNSASNTGGGVGTTTATNCTIYNNNATNGGGAHSGTLINCSAARNKANLGAGTYNTILKNTVVYGNKTGALVKSNVYNVNASAETYSAFEDEVRAGTGNISLSVNNSGDATSPCFQSLSTDVGVVDEVYVSNLKICNDSYLIDKGLDSYLTTGYGSLYDIESKPRKVGTIDIGAYENQKTV